MYLIRPNINTNVPANILKNGVGRYEKTFIFLFFYFIGLESDFKLKCLFNNAIKTLG